MRNKISKILIACFLCVWMAAPAMAQSIPEERLYPRLVDNADLLDDFEETELLAKLDEISERQQFDVVVVTEESLNGKTSDVYADDFYDYNGYGMGENADGALLLISMEEREGYISSCGYGITAITDAGAEFMYDQIVPDLSDGNYVLAFESFAEWCDDFVTQAKAGNPYDAGNLPGSKMGLFDVLIALVFGLVFAEIPMLVMRSKLKSVHKKNEAGNYVKHGSKVVNVESDRFLYHTVTRQRKPKENQSSGGSTVHRSSSGRSHGGGGGKF